jgi:signal transduction histidine kinase
VLRLAAVLRPLSALRARGRNHRQLHARIFDLIGAVKDYSNMDRAPILEVDVPAGLDATLQMLARAWQREVERDYQPDLPRISAYGGELNQVWTALIENALDALGNQGRLRVACRLEAEMLLVEIWDPAPAFLPSCRSASSSRSSPPRRPAKGLAWASTTPCASCASTAAI